MSGHINLQTSWVSALLERAITGSGVGKKKTRKKWISARICILRGRRTSLEMPIEIPPIYFLLNLYIDRTKRKGLGILSQALGNY